MLKMELAEVVNPHFAVPVFGVVLCAVLVFAFGFKSSVQPPSFDFDEEKRLRKRKGKKAQTNGHILSQSVAVVTVAKQQVSATKSSAKAKSEESLQAKLRNKKVAASPKPAPAKQDVVAKATEPVEDVDGWTTAISKKVKKRRNKEQPDDVSKYDLQDQELSGGEVRIEDVQEAPVASVEDVTAESPKSQRKRKEKKQRPVKEATKTNDVSETSVKDVPDAQKTVSAKMDKDMTLPEQDVELSQDKVKLEEEKPTEVVTTDDQTGKAEVVTSDEPPKRSPKKVRSKKDKVAAAPEIEEPKPVRSTEALNEVQDKKSKKSPKKKKKGTSQDASEASETPLVKDVESSHISTSHIAEVSSSKVVQETVSQGAAHDDSNQQESVDKSNSTTEGVSNPQASSSPVTFDELGAEDWQEAKPQKKKKKTRREN